MIFSGELETRVWTAFLTRNAARLTVDAEPTNEPDTLTLTVKLNRHRNLAVTLARDDRFLLGTCTIGQAATMNMLQLALTFAGWQDYPHYALALRNNAQLVWEISRPWPSLHAERDLHDLTIGLAETAGQLTLALERGLTPAPSSVLA